jgi:DNA invertase Pin-like site-specific DNA recombinase
VTNKSKADEVKRLYEAGWSAIRIANALQISPQGVYWHLERMGLPTPSQRKKKEKEAR